MPRAPQDPRTFLGLIVRASLTTFVIAWLGFSPGVALAQTTPTITVRRNVNLRPDPSTTHTPIRLLPIGEVAELLDTVKVNQYWHVQTDAGENGWVWSKNVERSTEAAELGPSVTTFSAGTSPAS